MKSKYYLKEKCKKWDNLFNTKELREQQRCDKYCIYCHGNNFVRGVDVTELVDAINKKLEHVIKTQKGFFYRIENQNIISDLIEVVGNIIPK